MHAIAQPRSLAHTYCIDCKITHLAAVCKLGNLLVLVQPHQGLPVALPLLGQQRRHAFPDAAGASLKREPAGKSGWEGGQGGRGDVER